MVGIKLHRSFAAAAVLWLSGSVWAASEQHAASNEAAQLEAMVSEIMKDNSAFVKSHKPAYFSPFAEKQHPRATVVTCADSRVHTHAMDATPDGDLFMVRNIGNQVGTAEGSVEYGVHHLHTPLLIIVGHVACGAIKAAQGNYSAESTSIRRELDSIRLPAANAANNATQEWLRGVDANVNNQVAYALKKFELEVKEGKLTVIGAIYDFQNALHQGYGKLVVTNINGQTDSASVLASLNDLTAARPAHASRKAAAADSKASAASQAPGQATAYQSKFSAAGPVSGPGASSGH